MLRWIRRVTRPFRYWSHRHSDRGAYGHNYQWGDEPGSHKTFAPWLIAIAVVLFVVIDIVNG